MRMSKICCIASNNLPVFFLHTLTPQTPTHSWFHGQIKRQDAEKVLMQA